MIKLILNKKETKSNQLYITIGNIETKTIGTTIVSDVIFMITGYFIDDFEVTIISYIDSYTNNREFCDPKNGVIYRISKKHSDKFKCININ